MAGESVDEGGPEVARDQLLEDMSEVERRRVRLEDDYLADLIDGPGYKRMRGGLMARLGELEEQVRSEANPTLTSVCDDHLDAREAIRNYIAPRNPPRAGVRPQRVEIAWRPGRHAMLVTVG